MEKNIFKSQFKRVKAISAIKVFWLGFLADYMLKGKILLNMNTKQNKLLKSKHKSDNFSSESKIESENESDFL